MRPTAKVRQGVPFLVLLALAAFLVAIAAACGEDATSTPTVAPTGTPTAAPTAVPTTPAPTETVAPTETASPTETATEPPTPTETATEPPTPTATETPTGPADAAPADQQNLIVQSFEPEKIDPHQSNFAQDITLARMLFRGLYQLDQTGQPEASMAADLPELNGNVYTVTLKEGLVWSDGTPLLAGDFVAGVQEGCNPANASPYQYVLAAGYAGIVGCNEYFGALGTADAPLTPTEAELQALRDGVGAKALDDLTLEFTVDKPTATFATILSLWVAFPSPTHVIATAGADWTKPENIVGNGPYVMTEYTAKDKAVLAPNPNWALDQKPLLQTLTIRFIDDLEAAFRGFQSGELDMTNVGAQSIPVIEGDPALAAQFLKIGASRIDTIEMNMAKPPLDNFDVRLALSQSLDRQAINDVVYNGANNPALFWVVEGLAGFIGNDEYADIDYDPDSAKAALERAGYPNGEGFPTLHLTLRDDPTQKALGEFLQAQWNDALGITVELDIVDAKTRSAKFNSSDFELFRGGWQIDYPDIENVIGGLFDTGGGNNKYNCSDPDIDAKIVEAQSATDNDARIAAWSEAGKLVVHKLCGVAPFAQVAYLWMASPKVGGLLPNGVLDSNLPGDAAAEFWYVKAQ